MTTESDEIEKGSSEAHHLLNNLIDVSLNEFSEEILKQPINQSNITAQNQDSFENERKCQVSIDKQKSKAVSLAITNQTIEAQSLSAEGVQVSNVDSKLLSLGESLDLIQIKNLIGDSNDLGDSNVLGEFVNPFEEEMAMINTIRQQKLEADSLEKRKDEVKARKKPSKKRVATKVKSVDSGLAPVDPNSPCIQKLIDDCRSTPLELEANAIYSFNNRRKNDGKEKKKVDKTIYRNYRNYVRKLRKRTNLPIKLKKIVEEALEKEGAIKLRKRKADGANINNDGINLSALSKVRPAKMTGADGNRPVQRFFSDYKPSPKCREKLKPK